MGMGKHGRRRVLTRSDLARGGGRRGGRAGQDDGLDGWRKRKQERIGVG